MRSGAPVRKLKLASGGRGEMQFDTEWLPKSSLSLRKTSKTIKHSKRLSSRRDDVERELVLRLASLLWRVRRASAIETDLFQIQAEILSGVWIRDWYRTAYHRRLIKRFDHEPELKARIPQRLWRSMMSNLREVAYRIDPALWVRHILGVEPTKWHEDF
jgi:hypothetical protein